MAEPLVRVEADGPVAVIRLARGRANALDTGLCREITARFGELDGGAARAVVLTGQGSIFCAGVDLLSIRDGGPGYLDEFLPALSDAFLAVFDCPVPVVAAVNGPAVAGGCVLACACDYRVMSTGRGRIGVTELLVGVPFPVAALEIMRFAVGARLSELTLFGLTYPAEVAVSMGLIDEVAADSAVLARAIEVAGRFAALPPAGVRQTRAQVRAPVAEYIARHRGADDAVRAIWGTAEARAAIAAYVDRVLPGH